jgi:hypothetical protein
MSSLMIERKVKGGKLFRLRVNRSGNAVSVQLSGDFFLEPDEGIAIVEGELANCLNLTNRREAEIRLADVIARSEIRITGFEVSDIIDALWEVKS